MRACLSSYSTILVPLIQLNHQKLHHSLTSFTTSPICWYIGRELNGKVKVVNVPNNAFPDILRSGPGSRKLLSLSSPFCPLTPVNPTPSLRPSPSCWNYTRRRSLVYLPAPRQIFRQKVIIELIPGDSV